MKPALHKAATDIPTYRMAEQMLTYPSTLARENDLGPILLGVTSC